MTSRGLVLGPHAQDQMAERSITEADVQTVLANPLFRRPSYDYREEVYGHALDGRTLKVVIVEGSLPPIVVTVMPIRRSRVERLRRTS